MHAFTVDLEEWFCTHNFQGVIKYEEWNKLESRVAGQVERLLGLLDQHEVKATFFVLGWVAERHPALIKKIAREGHEIGSQALATSLPGSILGKASNKTLSFLPKQLSIF